MAGLRRESASGREKVGVALVTARRPPGPSALGTELPRPAPPQGPNFKKRSKFFLESFSMKNFKKFLNAREGGGRTGPGHGESGGLQAVQRPAAFDVDHPADPHDQGDAAHDASGPVAVPPGPL